MTRPAQIALGTAVSNQTDLIVKAGREKDGTRENSVAYASGSDGVWDGTT